MTMIVIKTDMDKLPENCLKCEEHYWHEGRENYLCRRIDDYVNENGRHKDCPLAECEEYRVKLRFKKPQKMELA